MERSNLRWALILALPILLTPHAARAGAVATFVVDMSGSTVSGATRGTILGIGTATLSSDGTLTMLLTTKAVTGWTESVQDSTTVIRGVLVANVLTTAAGRTRVTSCTRTGGFFDACSHVALNVAQRFDPDGLARPITFRLEPGGVTRFEAHQTRALGAVVHYVFHLTALTALPAPEPSLSLPSVASSAASDCALR
jgi:hypothetical protein